MASVKTNLNPSSAKHHGLPFADMAVTTVDDGTGTMLPIGRFQHLVSVNGK